MRRTALVKLAGLLVLVLLVGSNLILPAGAHVTTRLPHLQGHLDPRYVNVNEMAANSNLLDGQDSTAFLGANAKAADADLLDGQNSTAFLGANSKAADADLLDGLNSSSFVQGTMRQAARVVPPNSGSGLPLQEPGVFSLQYNCPAVLTQNGQMVFIAHATTAIDLFIDDGSEDPAYHSLAPAPQFDLVTTPANATGEHITYQVHAGAQEKIWTIHLMSVHRASNCYVQGQTVVSG
jgi:hypothetical protein